MTRAVVAFVLFSVLPESSAQTGAVVIRAKKIHTVTRGTIDDGVILVSGGKIRQVGKTVVVPPAAVEYRAEEVVPGMIDAHAHIALDRSSRTRIPGPVTSEWKAVDHLDLEDPMIQVALAGGVTSLITRPGSGVISSGQAVALKMKAKPGKDMIFKSYVDLKMAVRPLINLRPGETPQTVMGWYATADEAYRRAEIYLRKQEDYQAGRLELPPEPDERLEALAAVLGGEVMVHVHSHYPSEIMMVMRLARKYGFIDRLTLGHAEEVFPLAELLGDTKVIPVIGPMMIVQYFGDPAPHHVVKELMEAGVSASIQTDMSRQQFRDFREYGAFMVRHGLKEEHALQALTINGAKAMGLDHRVGSIEPGKDADLVLLDGPLFDLTSDRIDKVFVDGKLEYERGELLPTERPRSVGPFGPYRTNLKPTDTSFAVTNAHVFTVSHGEIRSATLVVQEGRFAQVLAGGAPSGMPTLDVGGRVIVPGWILARAFPNDWIGDLKWQVQNDEITEPIVPEMNAVFAVDPWFPSYEANLDMGITSIHVTPGRQNLIGGSGVVIRTAGMDVEKMVRREPASMVFSLSRDTIRYWSKDSRIPVTLASASRQIRAALDEAREYSRTGAEREHDPRKEALLPVLRREVPAVVHANREDEIREAIRLARDYGLRLVVTGGVEAHRLAGELAEANAGVILGDSGTYTSDIRGGGEGWSVQGPAILTRARVRVAFFGPGASRRAMPSGRLGGEPALNAAWAFRNGVPEVQALRMASLHAAEMLGMEEEIGSIEVGKRADFLVLEGHPFDYRVLPQLVFVEGELVSGSW